MDIVRYDTTLPQKPSADLGTIINTLLSTYDWIKITLPGNSSVTWNVPVDIYYGRQVEIEGTGWGNGASNITDTIYMTTNGTYTDQNCNGGNPTRDPSRASISQGALRIAGVYIYVTVCDNRPLGCASRHKGIFTLGWNTGFSNKIGNNNGTLMFYNVRIYSNEDFISIGEWARANVFFGWTYFDLYDANCRPSIYAVKYDSGWNVSGGFGWISRSHTFLGNGVSFDNNPRLYYSQ